MKQPAIQSNLKAVFSAEEPVTFSETYVYANEGNTFSKYVTYWLCKMEEGEPSVDEREIINAKWVLLKDVMTYISFPSRKELVGDICTALRSL